MSVESVSSKHKRECWDKADKALAASNACLNVANTLNHQTGVEGYALEVPLTKLDAKGRKPLPRLLATYCPICGEKVR